MDIFLLCVWNGNSFTVSIASNLSTFESQSCACKSYKSIWIYLIVHFEPRLVLGLSMKVRATQHYVYRTLFPLRPHHVLNLGLEFGRAYSQYGSRNMTTSGAPAQGDRIQCIQPPR